MVGWKLFSRLLLGRGAYDNPLYVHEARYSPFWYEVVRRVLLASGFRAVLLAAGAIGYVLAVLYVNNLLFFLVPLLLGLALSTGLTIGPLVAKERVNQRWELLLTTPGGVENVLLGKVGGALWWLRRLLLVVTAAMLLAAGAVGVLSLIFIPAGPIRTGELPVVVLCGVLVVLPLASGMLFLIDRLHQYLLMIAAAVAAGTPAGTVRGALSNASGAILLVWVLEIVVAGSLLALQTGGVVGSGNTLLTLITLGPIASYILELDLTHAILYALITLAARELLITLVWRWSVRRARR